MEQYDITLKATEDLYRIWEYTVDTWSEDQADKYYGLLKVGMNDIARSPSTVGKAYDEVLPGLRGYHVQKHVLFYTVQANGRPLIVRVLHERMDYSIHFK